MDHAAAEAGSVREATTHWLGPHSVHLHGERKISHTMAMGRAQGGGGWGWSRKGRQGGMGERGGEAKGRSRKLKKSAATKKVPSALLS